MGVRAQELYVARSESMAFRVSPDSRFHVDEVTQKLMASICVDQTSHGCYRKSPLITSSVHHRADVLFDGISLRQQQSVFVPFLIVWRGVVDRKETMAARRAVETRMNIFRATGS